MADVVGFRRATAQRIMGVVTHVECQRAAKGWAQTPTNIRHRGELVNRVRVTGDESGGGKYTGFLVSGPAVAIGPTGNLADADLGANGGACLIVNAAEAGKATHDLTTGTPTQKTFMAVYIGRTTEATPRPVYMVNGFDLGDCE